MFYIDVQVFFLPTLDNDKNANIYNIAELTLFTWCTFNFCFSCYQRILKHNLHPSPENFLVKCQLYLFNPVSSAIVTLPVHAPEHKDQAAVRIPLPFVTNIFCVSKSTTTKSAKNLTAKYTHSLYSPHSICWMCEVTYMSASVRNRRLDSDFHSLKACSLCRKGEEQITKVHLPFESLTVSQRLLCYLHLLKRKLGGGGRAEINIFTVSWLMEDQAFNTRNLLVTTHQTRILIISDLCKRSRWNIFWLRWGNKSTDTDLAKIVSEELEAFHITFSYAEEKAWQIQESQQGKLWSS